MVQLGHGEVSCGSNARVLSYNRVHYSTVFMIEHTKDIEAKVKLSRTDGVGKGI